MNVDRLPDTDDDARPAADTTPLTEPPQPEAAAQPGPTPDQLPPPEVKPEPERKWDPDREREPTREQSPDPPNADSLATSDNAPEPAEPRSRQEHANDIPPPNEPPPGNHDSADLSGLAGEESLRDYEQAPPSTRGDSPETEDLSPHGGVPADRTEGSESQEKPSGEAGIKPDVAAEYGNRPTEDAPDEQPDYQPTHRADEAPAPEAPPGDPTISTPATADGEASRPDDGGPIGDQTRLLSDGEWAEHITEVRDGLSKAYEQNLNTDFVYTINGAGEVWLEQRERLHDAILEDLYGRAANVPCDSTAIVAGGLGGAGKTTVLTQQAGIDMSQYLMINPDDIKEEMACRGMIPEIDGLSPMESSELVHEESSYLAKRLAHRAQADGKNLVWDITMSSERTTAGRINDLRKAGYTQVDGLFVDISVETSIRRIESRHREGHDEWRNGKGLGGRYVPPEIVEGQAESQWGSKNRKTYEAMKERLDNWSTYDNSVDDRPAELIESSQGRQGNHVKRFR